MSTILMIADDSPQKMMLIKGMLTRAGWRGDIVTAATTEESRRLIEEYPITHALVDYYIPSENGPAVIRYLKEKRPGAHAALVSSSDKYENLQEAENAGAEATICTSYPADEVEKAFTDLLADWQA
jgi:DNA-binding NarL/FixJ family response regulator